ncbi:hypothetical protein EB796_014489 [Bugula neritina]|uniref:Uncharacterized protein n=1 Tax=Bugula neritina TaxID=10212 RepID=A0A7J7JLG5_BUGNE|nr:hypothetical protein EB796_014489 [Bugula neritina]
MGVTNEMTLATNVYDLDMAVKPRSLQLLDQAYDESKFKFSQIIRFLQDHHTYSQEVVIEPCDYSTSPLLVDPKLAYDIHTGKYMRTFTTQGTRNIRQPLKDVVQLPVPPPVANKIHYSTESFPGISPNNSKFSNRLVHSVDASTSVPGNQINQSQRRLRRRQVWRLPSHISAFTGCQKYKKPMKLPPITVSKLMNGI